MSNTLYTYPENFRAYKALLAAQFSKVPLEIKNDFQFGVTNKTEDFFKKFPLGKVPALETSSGQTIFDHNSIAYYLANDQLRGSNLIDQTYILQWTSFVDNELVQPVVTLVFPVLKILSVNEVESKRANEQLVKLITILNNHLENRTYFVGDHVTLADLSVFSTLLILFQHVWDNEKRDEYANLNKWFNNLKAQKEFEVLGDLNLKEAEKKEPDEPSKKSLQQKEVSLGPESKDPFLKFPAGTFVLDAFKRVYSNKPVDESLKYFWENFDKEHYSIWYSEYLYPEELTLVFMSANLVFGMFQRLDKLRKHGFASVCLFGEDNNITISGIWIWRGHELAFKLSEDLQTDYESYSWKKLDPDDERTKKLVNEYLAWEGDFDGKRFNQGRIFK